jgi:hypothetical protein
MKQMEEGRGIRIAEWRQLRVSTVSTPELRGNEFPNLEPPTIFCIFRAFFLFFFSNPCGLKNRYRSLRTEAKAHLRLSSLSAVGKVPGDSAESPATPESSNLPK